MWFIGMVAGAVIGSIGGFEGVFVGAVAGLVAGLLITQQRKGMQDKWRQDIEDAVHQLSKRVKALEEARGISVMPDDAAAAETTAAPAEPVVAAVQATPPLSADPHPELAEQAAAPEPNLMREPAAPAAPLSPKQPSALWKFFFGGNTLVRFGVIVLFFGVAFLLKYAAEHTQIPIEVRLAGVALGAVVLLVIGWRLRLARPGYGLIMQGGGIGVFYLTLFAAFRLYQLLPAGVVLALLTAMAVFSAMLAVMQDSRSLAALGVSGGFLAPVLASTGGGSHVMLFSFYALLNLGILGIAWHKAWRSLNLLGFAFTFIIGLMWGSRYYRPELFASTEPFLVLFFLFYVAIAVLFAVRQEASIKSRVDGTLVFGTPLIAFGLQAALVREIEYGAAFSALALSAFYLVLAKTLFSRAAENLRLLTEAFVALGVVFATLAIPLALDGRWTSAAWALEGAAIAWVSMRQDRRLALAFGLLLQFAAGFAFLFDAGSARAAMPVFNSAYLGGVFVSVAGLFCAWFLRRHPGRLGKIQGFISIILFVWGVLWWFVVGMNEIDVYVKPAFRAHAGLLFVAASCAALSLLHRRLQWRDAKYPALALLPLMYLFAAEDVSHAAHPFERLGFVAWPLAFFVHLWLLRRHENDTRHLGWWHAAGLWLFSALAAWEFAWLIMDVAKAAHAWQLLAWALVPGALLAGIATRGKRLPWPVARHYQSYLTAGATPLAAYLWIWTIVVNFFSNGDAAPLPYLPLLNPLDLAQAGALLALFAWLQRMRAADSAPQILRSGALAYAGLGMAAFVWLNGMLLRTLHHWAEVPFVFDAMLRSMLVQAAFSIFWSVLALCAMLTATRLGMRPIWLTGAGLMAAVVVKLFFIDLSNVGGVERIVSFMGVGLLMLVIGYVSPVPPRAVQEEGK
jgi:uncharacterized membrane protein